jgi:CRISPR/Cas system-associated exonuclease Cas4 (RecB family)
MSKEIIYAYEFDFNGERRMYQGGFESEAEADYWFLDYLKPLLNIKEKVVEIEIDRSKKENINDLIDEALDKVEWEDYYGKKG